MSRSKAIALVSAFAASLLVVLVVPICARDRETDPEAFVRAMREPRARALLRAGDIVLVHPPWRDDVVRALRDEAPLPDGARVTAALAPRHGDPLPPLVVITDEGMPLPRALAHAIDETASVQVDRLRVFRLVSTAGKDDDARDLTMSLSEARVEVRTRGGESVLCPWDAIAQRHSCPGLPEWMYVGMQELSIDGKRERCVWAHPTTSGSVSIFWERAPLRREVLLDVALTDTAADNRDGAPVNVELRLDGSSVGAVTTVPGRRGFRSSPFPVPNVNGSLELVVTAEDDGQRHACFRLRTQDTP